MFGVGSAGRIATSLLKGNRKMANTKAAFGFRQVSGTGATPSYEQTTALIKSDYTYPIYFGDPVYPLSTGYIAGSSVTPGTVQIAGIFVGCKYLSVSQKRTVWSNYWPGSDNNGDVTAYIVTDPNANFLVQVGGSSSTGLDQGDIGANVQFAYGDSAPYGNTANGISTAYVVYNSDAVTDTLPFRVKSLVTEPPGSNGTESGAYNYVIVGFNNVSTKQLTSVG
jgi:hypothetical protein